MFSSRSLLLRKTKALRLSQCYCFLLKSTTKLSVFNEQPYLGLFRIFSRFSYKFNDLNFYDDDTFKATLRIFLEFDLVSQFNIPYKVRLPRR